MAITALSLDERTRGKLQVCVISVGSYIWARLVFSPLIYSINSQQYSRCQKRTQVTDSQRCWATGNNRESKHNLAPGCRHPPVNWSRPSTRCGRRLSFMSIRHIFLIRFVSFGKRYRSSPSEGKGAPWHCSGTVTYETEHGLVFLPRTQVIALTCSGTKCKCCTLHTHLAQQILNSLLKSHRNKCSITEIKIGMNCGYLENCTAVPWVTAVKDPTPPLATTVPAIGDSGSDLWMQQDEYACCLWGAVLPSKATLICQILLLLPSLPDCHFQFKYQEPR